MDTNKFAGMTAGIVVMLLLASAVLVPTIDGARMTTTTISNEGAGWAKFAYYEDSEDYSVALSSDGTTLTMGTQSGTADDMIVWATDAAAVIHDAGSFTLLYEDGDSSAAADLGSSATIASVSGALTITDSSSTEVYTSDAVEWTYAPNAGGAFGFFTESGATVKDFPVATAGAFAGAYAYNSINSLGLNFSPTYSVSDGVFTMGDWEIPNVTRAAKVVRTIADTEEKTKIENLTLVKDTTTIKAVVDPSTGTLVDNLYYTFSGTSATVVGISSSLVSATSITIPDTVTYSDTTYNVTAIADGNYNTGVFQNLTTLETVTFSSHLTKIGDYAFSGCTSLALTSLPNGLTYIGTNAFAFATSLALTSLPSGITTIKSGAFQECRSLALTSLPDGLTSIPNRVFYNCTTLALTSLPDNLVSIGESAFSGCTSLALTSLPNGLTSISKQAFYRCASLALTSLPDGLTSIPNETFRDCFAMSGTLILSENITQVGSGAFYNCGYSGLIIKGSPTLTSSSTTFGNNQTDVVIMEVLNLGTTSITAGSYGLSSAAVVQDYISPAGYIAPVSFSETTAREGAIYDLMGVIPLLIIASILLAVTSMIIVRRE